VRGSRRWRQKLLKEIQETPVDQLARNVLTYRRFRKRFLLDVYLDRCDDLASEAPQEGLKLAESAPEFARLTKLAEGTLDDDSAEMRAWMIIGTAHRALGAHREAEAAYNTASTFRASADDSASLRLRMAILRTDQGRHMTAFELADAAVSHFEARSRAHGRGRISETDHCSLATALVVRGFTQVAAYYQGENIDGMDRPVRDFVTAIKCSTDTTPKARRAALQNLIGMAGLAWIGEERIGLNPQETDVLMNDIIRKIRIAHGPASLSLAKALWVQGSARARLAGSMVPRARYPFRDALSIFEKQGRWEAVVQIRLEMAWWYLQCSDARGALQLVSPLLAPEMANRYPRHWLAVLQTLTTTCNLSTAADAIREIRGIKVPVPDCKAETEPRGRWESEAGW